MSLRVLITNIQLDQRSGTEVYVYELALALARCGHQPLVYSPRLGPLADMLAQQSIPVTDNIEKITTTPDVIHGHHSFETMTAVCRFPSVPAVFFCHDFSAWHDTPPIHPRVLHYVAVDQTCKQRLLECHGLAEQSVSVIYNSVDLAKFKRRTPLPQVPRKAAIFSNYMKPQQAAIIESACEKFGLTLEMIGESLSGISENPEDRLLQYDIVFAKGRCAREALATGNCVIACDAQGMGPMVTANNLTEMNGRNFGRRVLLNEINEPSIWEQLQKYNAEDACQVTDTIRQANGLNFMINELTCLYEEVIEACQSQPNDIAAEATAVARFLNWASLNHHARVKEQARKYRLGHIFKQSWSSVSKQACKLLSYNRAA